MQSIPIESLRCVTQQQVMDMKNSKTQGKPWNPTRHHMRCPWGYETILRKLRKIAKYLQRITTIAYPDIFVDKKLIGCLILW